LNRNPLHLIAVHLVAPAIIELRGAGRGVVRHGGSVFEGAAVLKVRRDASRPARVIADRGIDASGTGIAELPVNLKVSGSLDLSGTGITTLPDESAGGFTGSSRQRAGKSSRGAGCLGAPAGPVRPAVTRLSKQPTPRPSPPRSPPQSRSGRTLHRRSCETQLSENQRPNKANVRRVELGTRTGPLSITSGLGPDRRLVCPAAGSPA
jgi:hypothetical protein